MNIDWEILIHGVETAVAGYQLQKTPWLGAGAGLAIGAGSVVLADNIMSQLMQDPNKKKSPAEAMVVGTIEDTVSALALSLLMENPISMATVGLAALYGIPEGIVIHSLEGEIDWQHPFSWN